MMICNACEENRHIKYNSRSCCEQIITAIMCIFTYSEQSYTRILLLLLWTCLQYIVRLLVSLYSLSFSFVFFLFFLNHFICFFTFLPLLIGMFVCCISRVIIFVFVHKRVSGRQKHVCLILWWYLILYISTYISPFFLWFLTFEYKYHLQHISPSLCKHLMSFRTRPSVVSHDLHRW